MTVVNLLIVAALLIVDQRLKRRLARQAQAEATALPVAWAPPV